LLQTRYPCFNVEAEEAEEAKEVEEEGSRNFAARGGRSRAGLFVAAEAAVS
jgi:hypothetical protein